MAAHEKYVQRAPMSWEQARAVLSTGHGEIKNHMLRDLSGGRNGRF